MLMRRCARRQRVESGRRRSRPPSTERVGRDVAGDLAAAHLSPKSRRHLGYEQAWRQPRKRLTEQGGSLFASALRYDPPDSDRCIEDDRSRALNHGHRALCARAWRCRASKDQGGFRQLAGTRLLVGRRRPSGHQRLPSTSNGLLLRVKRRDVPREIAVQSRHDSPTDAPSAQP